MKTDPRTKVQEHKDLIFLIDCGVPSSEYPDFKTYSM